MFKGEYVRAHTHIRGIGFPHSFSIVCALLQAKTNAEWCHTCSSLTQALFPCGNDPMHTPQMK